MVFLQETYFKSNNIPNLHNKFYPIAYHATTSVSKSKGVSLISKNCPIQIQDTLLDVNQLCRLGDRHQNFRLGYGHLRLIPLAIMEADWRVSAGMKVTGTNFAR